MSFLEAATRNPELQQIRLCLSREVSNWRALRVTVPPCPKPYDKTVLTRLQLLETKPSGSNPLSFNSVYGRMHVIPIQQFRTSSSQLATSSGCNPDWAVFNYPIPTHHYAPLRDPNLQSPPISTFPLTDRSKSFPFDYCIITNHLAPIF